MERRQDRITRYITDSRAEMQLPMMAERALGATVQQWIDRLRFVPDLVLDDCYQMAMDAHATRNAVMPKELQDQWQILRQRGVTGRPRVNEEKRCEFWCSEDGWIIVDAAGDVQISYPKKVEYLYAKPCPVHRPNGFKRNEQAAPFCAGDWPRVRTIESSHVPVVKNGPPTVEGWSSVSVIAPIQAPEERLEMR